MTLAFPVALDDAEMIDIVADLPDSIVMESPDGRSFACIANAAGKMKRLEPEGFFDTFDLTVVLRAALLVDGDGNPKPLQLRQKFTLARNGTRYRIERMSESSDSITMALEAVQVTG